MLQWLHIIFVMHKLKGLIPKRFKSRSLLLRPLYKWSVWEILGKCVLISLRTVFPAVNNLRLLSEDNSFNGHSCLNCHLGLVAETLCLQLHIINHAFYWNRFNWLLSSATLLFGTCAAFGIDKSIDYLFVWTILMNGYLVSGHGSLLLVQTFWFNL